MRAAVSCLMGIGAQLGQPPLLLVRAPAGGLRSHGRRRIVRGWSQFDSISYGGPLSLTAEAQEMRIGGTGQSIYFLFRDILFVYHCGDLS